MEGTGSFLSLKCFMITKIHRIKCLLGFRYLFYTREFSEYASIIVNIFTMVLFDAVLLVAMTNKMNEGINIDFLVNHSLRASLSNLLTWRNGARRLKKQIKQNLDAFYRPLCR